MDNIELFIGAPSFGKTTLLCKYYKKLAKIKKCSIIYSPCKEELSISDVIYSMYPTHIEIPTYITAAYLNELNTEVLLIDEVQNRSIEELDLLIRYADRKNIQILFFGTAFDVFGKIIPSIQHLIEVGISFTQIKRKCCKCGCKAFNTLHVNKSNEVLLSPINYDDYKILILCRQCYNKYMRKFKSEHFII